MKVDGQTYRTIWVDEKEQLFVINQLKLPHYFEIATLNKVDEVCGAISSMMVRGAGLIGATAAYGMWIAAREAPKSSFNDYIASAAEKLKRTRPTASNLVWAIDRQILLIESGGTIAEKISLAKTGAEAIANEDASFCHRIGQHGLTLLKQLAANKPGRAVNILTHCNAGWLAFVDYGTALSPIYAAHDSGISLHVWVDETRPRNQGASLTAWELAKHGIPHSLIADNSGGHLMQHGMVDIVFTGADRVTRNGDVANKIGTYLKALAAKDNDIPFYVALPSSTFDFSLNEGVAQIPIEERSGDEIRYVSGRLANGSIGLVQICPEETEARNWGFDVTPSGLITGLITERGICRATESGILNLYPESAK